MTKNIYVLAEHRKGHLRDITWEAIAAGRDLAAKFGTELACILLGREVDAMAEKLSRECSKVLVVDDPIFETFNSEAYTKALAAILQGRCPFILLMGNSNSVLDLAPGLSVVLDAALATDCAAFQVLDGRLTALRQMYSYKVNALISFKDAERVCATLRVGAFSYSPAGGPTGTIERLDSPLGHEPLRKRFLNYVEAEKGDIDVAGADIIVSVGRGIGDEPDMELFEMLADAMGGVLACSRPIVDKSLLPKYHQVGTSGVEVKPKVYLALGISGAFQHLGGIKGSPVIIAINKDARAPIFRVAQFGVVADMYQIVPLLTEKIAEIKG